MYMIVRAYTRAQKENEFKTLGLADRGKSRSFPLRLRRRSTHGRLVTPKGEEG